ncbi:MAG: hypothetical protein HOB98_16335, partial [Gammaproteobacteria bacterium]|nr:hypothetical protein [Gammaproteobacteria bacterium]
TVDSVDTDDSVEAPATTIDVGVISVPESTPSGGAEEIVEPNASASTTE